MFVFYQSISGNKGVSNNIHLHNIFYLGVWTLAGPSLTVRYLWLKVAGSDSKLFNND